MTKAEVEALIETKVNEKVAALTDLTGTGDNPSTWAKEAVAWAKTQGVFNGDGNGNYGWQKPVTREQIAALLVDLTDTAGTGDNPSSWAVDCTDWAKANGVFNGDGNGNYGWQKPATREQIAAALNAFGAYFMSIKG